MGKLEEKPHSSPVAIAASALKAVALLASATAATSLERNCLWKAALRKPKPDAEIIK